MGAIFRTDDGFAYHGNGDIECLCCGALVRSSATHGRWHEQVMKRFILDVSHIVGKLAESEEPKEGI